jgi:hypothetical protein
VSEFEENEALGHELSYFGEPSLGGIVIFGVYPSSHQINYLDRYLEEVQIHLVMNNMLCRRHVELVPTTVFNGLLAVNLRRKHFHAEDVIVAVGHQLGGSIHCVHRGFYLTHLG